MRYAVIDLGTNLVVNVVPYDAAPPNPPPGFEPNHIAVASDMANPGDSWNGTAIVPKPVSVQPVVVTPLLIEMYRDKRLATGFADTAAGNTGKTWQCDPVSIGNWTAIAASAQPWALGLTAITPAPNFSPWGDDNQPVSLTAAQAYALFAQRVMPWVTATFNYARQMKTSTLAGSPPADYTQGWP